MKKIEDCISEEKYISVLCVITEKKLSELNKSFTHPFIERRKQYLVEKKAENYLDCIERYLNRRSDGNEIIFYTSYSYADIDAKKINFNMIFNPISPYESEAINISIEHILFEGKTPTDFLEHGHKHVCIFNIDANKVKLLDKLPKDDWNTKKWLGLCNSEDWENIKLKLIENSVGASGEHNLLVK